MGYFLLCGVAIFGGITAVIGTRTLIMMTRYRRYAECAMGDAVLISIAAAAVYFAVCEATRYHHCFG